MKIKSLLTASLPFTMLTVVTITVLVGCRTKTNNQGSIIAIIPQPATLQQTKQSFTIDHETIIQINGNYEIHEVASYLSEMISAASVFDIPVIKTYDEKAKNAITLTIEKSSKTESYALDINEHQVKLTAHDVAGLFYGIQTLRQLLPSSIEEKQKQYKTWSLPGVTIQDEPAYTWRGMHLDVSRHFFSKDFVLKFIDRLALYKFNKLHLHLTDDQGWRMEIKRYPQLTNDGAWRTLNDQDSTCLRLTKTNKDFELPSEFFKVEDGKTTYGGYYTQADIREIVAYAAQHHIEIIPEIDMPGHMKAALNSFPELSCVDGAGWGEIFSIPLCPCEESTYTFIENVLSEIVPLFPGEYIHIGADEVDKITWTQSPACQQRMKKEGFKNSDELQGYFVRRIEKYLHAKGKKMIGWDEVLEGGVDSTTTVMYWRGWVTNAPVKAATNGHNVIMTPTSHCYFDYTPDHTTLENTYMFSPIPDNLNEKQHHKILGVQANIWTEWIPTTARLDYMTMPRMIALAEVAWTRNKDFNSFEQRLAKHYDRLDNIGIQYRLPDIKGLKEHIVFIDKQELILEKPQGVTSIRYTTDGSVPDHNSKIYNSPITIDSTVTFTIQSIGHANRPGNIYTINFEKQQYRKGSLQVDTQSGLNCQYYEGSYNSVKNIRQADLKKEAPTLTMEIPTFCREDNFALVFNGYIQIQHQGIYTFYLTSDDGSVLKIGDQLVVDNDGYHGSKEVAGQIALNAGWHPIELRYFESGGGNKLALQYEAPEMTKQVIPLTAFKRSN